MFLFLIPSMRFLLLILELKKMRALRWFFACISADFLRIFLRLKDPIKRVPLKQKKFNALELYLEIEKVRFETVLQSRIGYSINKAVRPSTRVYILRALIENSIKIRNFKSARRWDKLVFRQVPFGVIFCIVYVCSVSYFDGI